jgi:hypothetical protein
VFSKYGEKIAVSWYNVDTGEGQQIMAKKGLADHVPLIEPVLKNWTVA